MVEEYEESIEDWYMKYKEKVSLTTYLCERQILKSNEKCTRFTSSFYFKFFKIIFFKACLYETFNPELEEEEKKKQKSKEL
jgi:hypothetical protein